MQIKYFTFKATLHNIPQKTEHLVLITSLQGLTQVEVINLLTTTWPVWLYKTCHELIPQDIMSFANRLPQLPSNLDIVVVRKVLISLTVTFMSEGLGCIALFSG